MSAALSLPAPHLQVVPPPGAKPVALLVLTDDGRTVSRADLLARVWGAHTTTGVRSVDVHVARLRAKLGSAAPHLVTVRGRGNRWDPA